MAARCWRSGSRKPTWSRRARCWSSSNESAHEAAVKPAQLLFAHQRLVDRERALRDDIERVETRLASDPEVVELEEALAQARAAQDVTAAKLRDSDGEREAHRTKLRSREKELMSGRI